jgi:hypothetical protein
MTRRKLLLLVSLTSTIVTSSGCGTKEQGPDSTFYSRKIGPILTGSCLTSPTGSKCHVSADDRGNALGNLDLRSFDTVNDRRDLLVSYGPYGMPGLLLKVVPESQLKLTSWETGADQIITTDIAHAGGSLIDVTSVSFTQISKWIENGATENNAPPGPKDFNLTPCTTVVGQDPQFDPNAATTPDYAAFQNNVNPLIGTSCAAGNCHGNPANTLYFTCGTSLEQERWNYFVASSYVSANAASSELLRRTLSPSQGGTYHDGGTIFDSPNDTGYQAILDWVTQKGGPSNVPTDPGFVFFAQRVQPMLVKRGCMQLGCHSAPMFHDYRLRGGSGGHFGLAATRKNYQLSLEQLSLESPDPNASRLVRKNLPPAPSGFGVLHRGGALFANGGVVADCGDLVAGPAATGPLDDQTPYCVIAAWIAQERSLLMAGAEELSGIVYVKRPPAPGGDTPQDYGTYAPGADLMQSGATMDPTTGVVTTSAGSSILGSCGLSAASADVRRPAVSWDGKKIAFSARSGANEGFQVYVIDGASCAPDPVINAPPADENGSAVPSNGELVHNFDPAFAPDGRIVFTSTRGNIINVQSYGYTGVTRTPADPSKLNANLYVAENGKVRQLTFLLNQELYPSFMNDGRLIFTTEKRAPEFYQLAGRRMNLDGGDYHPLFGQRPTIGYNQFTEVVELSDKNLAAILSDKGAQHGGGTLAIINRSIGVDHDQSIPPDPFVQDPGGQTWQNNVFFQRSLRILDPAATGRPGGTQGAYRSPSPLPNGTLLVSYAPNVVDVGAFSGGYAIYQVDPITGAKNPLIQDADDLIWAVGIYARGNHGVFRSRIDEANGASTIFTDAESQATSEITYIDVPLLASLVFQNTRSKRILGSGGQLELWASLPPDPGVTDYSGADVTSDAFGQLFVRRRMLGSVGLESDGSAKVKIPAGMPVVLATGAPLPAGSGGTKHFQREEVQFYPGEHVRQSFRRELFNGLCAGCHGSVSGYENEIAVQPDILTQASTVIARGKNPTDFTQGTGAPKGPPFP